MERAPIRNRNREIRKVRVGDLRTNPANHRLHPDSQRAALDGILQEVGFVGTLIGFELPDGTVRLCDGHLRKDALDPDYEVDVCIVDCTPEERKKILATHDGIGALAQIDHQALEALMDFAHVQTPALQAMLADMSERSLDGPEDEGAPLDESEASSGSGSGSGPSHGDTWQVVVTCPSKASQQEVYDLLTGDGLSCRMLSA